MCYVIYKHEKTSMISFLNGLCDNTGSLDNSVSVRYPFFLSNPSFGFPLSSLPRSIKISYNLADNELIIK